MHYVILVSFWFCIYIIQPKFLKLSTKVNIFAQRQTHRRNDSVEGLSQLKYGVLSSILTSDI